MLQEPGSSSAAAPLLQGFLGVPVCQRAFRRLLRVGTAASAEYGGREKRCGGSG